MITGKYYHPYLTFIKNLGLTSMRNKSLRMATYSDPELSSKRVRSRMKAQRARTMTETTYRNKLDYTARKCTGML